MLKIPIYAHHFTTSTYTPMECLNIDFVGPFLDRGYILAILCTFARWIELYHTLETTALSAAECLLKHFGRFGAPYQLRSDNGPHFIADLIREFLLLIIIFLFILMISFLFFSFHFFLFIYKLHQ